MHDPQPSGRAASVQRFGTRGADRLVGSSGDDDLYGLGGNDALLGRDGDDLLSGGPGRDRLGGGAGDDTFVGGAGADVIDGAGGAGDIALYTFSPRGVAVSLTDGEGRSGHAAGDTLEDIDDLAGSRFGDVLVGDGGSNAFLGDSGADVLRGRGGADALDGEAGRDVLEGGGGPDIFVFTTLAGGADRIVDFRSNDVIDVDALAFDASDPVVELEAVGEDALLRLDPDGGGFFNVARLVGGADLDLIRFSADNIITLG